MTKVITYGTYDLLHHGHIRLLERAKELGDYLIVGVTADDFDMHRGKINVSQSLIERIEAVKATGLADEIIVEEYEGQKIDDIRKYGIDIFTVGSDWVGKFDYLGEYCKVVYLERTEGVSSTEIRSAQAKLKLGLVGNHAYINKFLRESRYVNGVEVVGANFDDGKSLSDEVKMLQHVTNKYEELLSYVDAVYIHSTPKNHYNLVKKALELGKHVICESPIALKKSECIELLDLAKRNKLILMDSLRTAYATAFDRMLLSLKSGIIGDVVSIDAVCTSLKPIETNNESDCWTSLSAWGPTALLPVFSVLGTNYKRADIITKLIDKDHGIDSFTKVDFLFDNATASIKVGYGVKSEGELIISGTKGYVFVPAPWWKTDYYEFRFENSENNKRYFYQLDGEGIRNELVAFLRAVSLKPQVWKIAEDESIAISSLMEKFFYEKTYQEI